jgi:SAM-dependent methyltransferase
MVDSTSAVACREQTRARSGWRSVTFPSFESRHEPTMKPLHTNALNLLLLPLAACGGAGSTDVSMEELAAAQAAFDESEQALAAAMADAGSGSPAGEGHHGHHDHHGEHAQPEAAGSGPHADADPMHTNHAQPHGHQHHFTDPASYAARWEGPERDAWQQPASIIDAMEIVPGMTVADLGTGTGYLLARLSEAAGSAGTVLAIDVEPAMLEWVEQRAATEGWTNVRAHAGTFDSPAVEAGSLDRAVMINVWHHIEHQDRYAASLLESLAADGRAFIVETRVDALEGPPMHYRLEPQAVIDVLVAAGLSASLHPWENERQYMVVATRPVAP